MANGVAKKTHERTYLVYLPIQAASASASDRPVLCSFACFTPLLGAPTLAVEFAVRVLGRLDLPATAHRAREASCEGRKTACLKKWSTKGRD